MQNAFSQDMFSLVGINSAKCNGHLPVSPASTGPKRDRKGCKKGKIEAIMKNNLVTSKARVRLQTAPVVKKIKAVQPVSNNIIKTGTTIKTEYIDSDDPYTFTETEPQTLSLYPGTNNLTLSRKLVPLVSNRSSHNQVVLNKAGTMVCVNRNSDLHKADKFSANKTDVKVGQSVELPPRPFLPKANNKVVQNNEGNSKTMNKLQAEIARSKIVGKRKKMVANSQSSVGWEQPVVVKSEPNVSNTSSGPVFAKVTIPAKRMRRQTTWQRERKLRHEALQRIQQTQQQLWDVNRDLYPLGLEPSDSEGEGEEDEVAGWGRGVFQRHWFQAEQGGGGGGGSRELRLAQLGCELRRRVCQAWRGLARRPPSPDPQLVGAVVAAARAQPVSTALLLSRSLKLIKESRAKTSMLVPHKCSLDCDRPALPCTRHCAAHILYNVDQLLYQHCSAQHCRAPVFDVSHQHPLCPQHARAYDSVMKSHSDYRPKKCARKKSKPSALTRSTKRGKKKKKPNPSEVESANEVEMSEVEIKTEPDTEEDQMIVQSSPSPHSQHPTEVFLTDAAPVSQVEIQVQLEDAGVEVVSDEVLAIASLDPAELANQASRLLEEHDITSMLNHLPADAFNDIFLEDKNGEYEPTREETEGLERALEEVDKEVRSLERMSRALPLALPMDNLPITLLDDVAPLPYQYPNGFAPLPATAASSDLHS